MKGNFINYTDLLMLLGSVNKNIEMVWACSTGGRSDNCIQQFDRNNGIEN
jgi:hypothetical protein